MIMEIKVTYLFFKKLWRYMKYKKKKIHEFEISSTCQLFVYLMQ